MLQCTNEQVGELIGLYDFGALEGPDLNAFLDHLIECAYCFDQVYSMEPYTKAFRSHRAAVRRGDLERNGAVLEQVLAPLAWEMELDEVPPQEAPVEVPARPFWLRKPFLAAASVVVTVGAGLWAVHPLWSPSNPVADDLPGAVAPTADVAQAAPSPWQDLEVPRPAYAPPANAGVFRGPNSEFERAMAAYQKGDFGAAADQLEQLGRLTLSDAAEVQFYLGVSLLLAGRNEEAIGSLVQAAQLNGGARRESSRYYLALAYLKTNRLRQAQTELDTVIAMNGSYRADAETLKQQLRR